MSTHGDDRPSGDGTYGQQPGADPSQHGRTEDGQQSYEQPAYGQQSYEQTQYAQPPYEQPQYGQPPYEQPQYGQPPYEQPSYEQAAYQQAPYGQAAYGQQSYGQPAYEQTSYGVAQPYGQAYPQQVYGQYGTAPMRPGGVVTAAVFGFVWGALGALVTLFAFLAGALAGATIDEADEAIPGLGEFVGAIAGAAIVFGVLALAWTVLMFWGSAVALSGRSRVPLIVGGSIAIAFTALMFIGGIGTANEDGPGGLVMGLIGLVISILIVVLLSNRTAAQFFAAYRARRGS